jgi:hypothetical protein
MDMMKWKGMWKEKCVPDTVVGKIPSEIFGEMMNDWAAPIGDSLATDRDNLANNR